MGRSVRVSKYVKCAKAIADRYRVLVGFRYNYGERTNLGYTIKDTITINLAHSGNHTKSGLLSTLYHELTHVRCYRHGPWSNYHRSDDYEIIVKCGLKAERWVDAQAELMFTKDFPRLRYHKSYRGSIGRRMFHPSTLGR